MDNSTMTMIANLEKNTGKKLADWVSILKKTGLSRHGEMVSHLKENHGFTHGFANLVALKAREKESGFNAPAHKLLDDQYKGKEELRPLYENLAAKIAGFGGDVAFAPKKTYVSLRRNKQFALIQPSTKTRLDIGINLRDREYTGRFEKAGSFNTMCSHRVRIESAEQIDEELMRWLKDAYEES